MLTDWQNWVIVVIVVFPVIYTYIGMCISQHCISCHLVLSSWFSKFGNCYPLFMVIFTSFKWSWSPFAESQWPVCIVLHWYCLFIKLSIIFEVNLNTFFSPKINVSSTFRASLCALSCQLWHKIVIFINFCHFKPFHSQIKFVILLTVNHTILIMLVQRI